MTGLTTDEHQDRNVKTLYSVHSMHSPLPDERQALLPNKPPSTPPSPSSASSSRSVQQRRVLGASLVFIVSVLWLGSSVIAQMVFGDMGKNSSFFITYVGMLMRTVVLLPIPWRSTGQRKVFRYGTEFRAAIVCAPVLFVCNWTCYSGLALTSVASASVLSSSSTLCALVITTLLPLLYCAMPSGDDQWREGTSTNTNTDVNVLHVIGTFITISGVSLVFLNDSSAQVGRSLNGDILSMISAFFFALYAVLLGMFASDKNACVTTTTGHEGEEDDEEGEGVFDADLFNGLSGLFMSLVAWPVFFFLNETGIEPFFVPSLRVLVIIAANALMCQVMPALIWVRAARMTTPFVTTLTSSLMVPMSITWDVLTNGKTFQWSYLVGAGLVLAGFFILNMDMDRTEDGKSSRKGEGGDVEPV